jgi:hypothetical protein
MEKPRQDERREAATEPSSELLSALSGREANRERAIAYRTRRVVLGSAGVLKESREGRSRSRAVAMAIAVIVLLLIAPLLWELTDGFMAGEHLGDAGNQLSMWACVACTTLLGAALVAGWLKRRS